MSSASAVPRSACLGLPSRLTARVSAPSSKMELLFHSLEMPAPPFVLQCPLTKSGEKRICQTVAPYCLGVTLFTTKSEHFPCIKFTGTRKLNAQALVLGKHFETPNTNHSHSLSPVIPHSPLSISFSHYVITNLSNHYLWSWQTPFLTRPSAKCLSHSLIHG